MESISPELLEKVFARIKEYKITDNQKISNKQYNHVVSTTRSIFNYGITHRKCTFNPAKAVEKVKISESPFTFLTSEEVVRFLTYAKSRNQKYPIPYYCYLLGFNLGLRIGEIIALKWSSIDFFKKSILINHAYDKQAGIVKDYPKSKRYRILFMNDSVEAALRELKIINSSSEWVFPNPSGTGHIDYRNFRNRIFRNDVRESGVSYFDFHGMRHTFAISYLVNGGLPHDLQLMLGHENIDTTMKYVRFTTDYLKSKAFVVGYEAKLPQGVSRISSIQKK